MQGVPREKAEAVIEASSKYEEFFTTTANDADKDFDKLAEPYYKVIADDIAMQKKRLGGTFAGLFFVQNKKLGSDFLC